MTQGFLKTLVDRFNMLWFVMALGLGGTSVAGFAVLNYMFPRPDGMKGLVSAHILGPHAQSLGGSSQALFQYLQVHIAAFGLLHIAALALVFGLFVAWRRKHPERYRELRQDTTRNAVTIAPALALGMTFNVLLTGGAFYSPWVHGNMQQVMGLGLAIWGALFLYTMFLALRIQKTYLEKGFDVLKMHFGWLLIPFALAMTAVSGSGIAALAKDPMIAKAAFMLALIPFTMAGFLGLVKLVSVFRSQYRLGRPERIEFLPSFFVIIPIVTLLAITLFRFGHFFDHHYAGHLPQAYYVLVTAGGWAFQLWYLALGVVLLGAYFKNNLFSMKYFDESQWSLICPMVALSVLGTFVYKTTLSSPVVFAIVLLFTVLDVVVIAWIASRQYMALVSRSRERIEVPASSVQA
jgi:tellurite resistance protein TehA-like permease